MFAIKGFIVMLLCLLLCAPMTQAQQVQDKQPQAQANKAISQDVTIIIQQEKVRFTAQKSVEEMRLEIFDQAGELIYDSGAITETELNWPLQNSNGEAVKSGLYAYRLSIKEGGAESARVRRGHFIVDRAKERDGKTDRLWITSQNEDGVGTELTVARNDEATIAGTSTGSERASGKDGDKAQREGEGGNKAKSKQKESQSALAVGGVGTPGQIAKFISEEEIGDSVITETANGNVGIGTTNPTAKLDVNGSSDPLLLINHTGAFGNPAIWFQQDGTPKAYMWWDQFNRRLNLGTPTTNPILSLQDNGNVGIGTSNPTSKLEIIAQDGLAITGFQPFLTLRDTNAAGARSILAGGNGDFGFYPNSFIGGYPAVLIKNGTGNVGIGTPFPQARLHVEGQTMTSVLQITR